MTDEAESASVPELVRAVATDRRQANSLLTLLGLIEDTRSNSSRLAAVEGCRSLFEGWVAAGELILSDTAEAPPPESADGAYQAWLRRAYRRYIAGLRALLSEGRGLAPRLAALDSLMALASLEARYARNGRVHHPALDAADGAYRQALDGLATARRPPPSALLTRLREAHLVKLDAAFYLLRHVRRLARLRRSSPPARLFALLKLVTPPASDVRPRDAAMLAPPGRHESSAAATKAAWTADAKRLLARKTHRVAYCKAWRALLKMQLPNKLLRAVLRMLPERVFPHVPRPLVYCDLLSDGYARGGAEGMLALRGLFVLMTQHNLEYPRFYARLYALLTPGSLCCPQRAVFAQELKMFLSSSGLPAYLLAAFAKRLARLALVATPAGAALGCALIFNLLLQHPVARALVHRPAAAAAAAVAAANGSEAEEADAEEDASTTAGLHATLVAAAAAADPFLAEEEDPEKCGSVESSLWEIDTLRKHGCATVASLAALLAAPMGNTTPPIELEPLGALTHALLGQLETRKRLKPTPAAVLRPSGLFLQPEHNGAAAGAKLLGGSDLGAWVP